MTQVSGSSGARPSVLLGAQQVRGAALRRDLLELSKPGIVKLVLVTTAVGFALAAMGRPWAPGPLLLTALWCLIGTALSAAGANALNMVVEVRRDALMHRTRSRPIPAGRLDRSSALAFGCATALLGVAVLWLGTNPVAALVSLASILSYVFLYTPLKPVTPLATLVGAFPGALPPLIGWTAASLGPWRGLEQMGGWSIFSIMFVWQVPHFLAIAWKYRDDYARGGFKTLPAIDDTGIRTARTALIWAIALVPLSLAPVVAMPQQFGFLYVTAASVAGIWFAWTAARLVHRRTDANARRLFFGSIFYLPVVLVTLVVDAVITGIG